MKRIKEKYILKRRRDEENHEKEDGATVCGRQVD